MQPDIVSIFLYYVSSGVNLLQSVINKDPIE